MYNIIQSNRIVFTPKDPSPLLFCTFLNQERILAIAQNGSFVVISSHPSTNSKILFEDMLEKPETIIDCKRIKINTCAIITKNVELIYFIKYVSDKEVLVGNIFISQMAFFKNLQITTELIPFGQGTFVIKNQYFAQKMTYFTIFKEQKKQQFNYDISVINYEQDPIASKQELFRPLLSNQQLCFFKQNEEEELNWKIKIISLNDSIYDKQIDLRGEFTNKNWIQDVMARAKDEYYIFTNNAEQLGKMEIYRCELLWSHSKYVQKIALLHNFQICSRVFLEIIDVNHRQKYFMLKTAAHTAINDQIYDNYLQMRHIDNGNLIEELPCNLKNIEVSPQHRQIVDYAQNINELNQNIIHLRYIHKKKCLQAFLLTKGKWNNINGLNLLYADILRLL